MITDLGRHHVTDNPRHVRLERGRNEIKLQTQQRIEIRPSHRHIRQIDLRQVALAQQFENVETLMVGFNGPDGSTLITERNKVALAVLADELKKGRTQIGVFYGAGHLSDMQERLADDFSLRERGISEDKLQSGVKASAIDVVIDELGDGAKVVWH